MIVVCRHLTRAFLAALLALVAGCRAVAPPAAPEAGAGSAADAGASAADGGDLDADGDGDTDTDTTDTDSADTDSGGCVDCPIGSGYPCPCLEAFGSCGDGSTCFVLELGDDQGVCARECGGLGDPSCAFVSACAATGGCDLYNLAFEQHFCVLSCEIDADCPPGTFCNDTLGAPFCLGVE